MFLGCKKDDAKHQANAEIFRFNAEKCGCCLGWYVKKGSDTLKIDVIPSGVNVSMDFTTPIPVYIELGAIKQDCPTFDYYHVTKLEVIK